MYKRQVQRDERAVHRSSPRTHRQDLPLVRLTRESETHDARANPSVIANEYNANEHDENARALDEKKNDE